MFRILLNGVVATALLLSFFGCSASRQVLTSSRDSVRVEVVVREVVVRDTVFVEIPEFRASAICQDSSLLSNDLARSEAIIRPDGALYHTLEIIPQQLKSPTRVVVDARDSIIYREITKTSVVEVERDLSRWQEFQIDGFWLILALLVAVIGVKLILR